MTPPASAGAVRSGAHAAPGRIVGPSPRPRRISGPVRAPARNTPRTAAPGLPGQQGLARAALDAFETLSSHRLLDRLIRSRIWIGLVAFALIGIVTLQLGMLKLNSGIGRSLEREQSLQRQNSTLSIEDSELAAGDRVETQAKKLGMSLVPEKSLLFLGANPHGDVEHALKALQTPVAAVAPESAPSTTATSGEEGEASAGSSEEPSSGAGTTTESSTETQAPSEETAAAGQGEATQSASSQETQGSAAPVEEGSADGGTQAAPAG
jgi:cell division protein FtsL